MSADSRNYELLTIRFIAVWDGRLLQLLPAADLFGLNASMHFICSDEGRSPHPLRLSPLRLGESIAVGCRFLCYPCERRHVRRSLLTRHLVKGVWYTSSRRRDIATLKTFLTNTPVGQTEGNCSDLGNSTKPPVACPVCRRLRISESCRGQRRCRSAINGEGTRWGAPLKSSSKSSYKEL